MAIVLMLLIVLGVLLVAVFIGGEGDITIVFPLEIIGVLGLSVIGVFVAVLQRVITQERSL